MADGWFAFFEKFDADWGMGVFFEERACISRDDFVVGRQP
jgi:hypothetical protein